MDPIISSLTIAQTEQNRRSLKENLNDRIALGDTAVIDWYTTLSLDNQILIKYDLNAALTNNVTILTQDAKKLNTAEKIILENYIYETLQLAISPTQIADLNTKLKAINYGEEYSTYLQEKLKSLSAPEKQNALIDWICTLSLEDQDSINLDVQAILLSGLFNKIDNQSKYISSKMNILELFKLKQNLELFLLGTNDQQDTIIAKVKNYLLESQESLTSDLIQNKIKDDIQFCEMLINKALSKYIEKNNDIAIFLDSNFQDPYAQIFRLLSIEEQSAIINTIENKKLTNQNTENIDQFNTLNKKQLNITFKFFEDELLPDRIKEAQTIDELDNIVKESTTAGLDFTPEINLLLKEKYKLIEIANNKATFENTKSTPDTSHFLINPNPITLNEETGGDEIININENKNISIDTDPINTNPQNIYNNTLLEEEENKEIEEEKKRKSNYERIEEENKKAQNEGQETRTII